MSGKPYSMTTPCSNCPFRSDIPAYLRTSRVREIERSLVRSEFPCHKTTESVDEGDGDGTRVSTKDSIHCAGALILMEKMGRSSQMMRIAERLGMYDHTKLDMNAPVFNSFKEMMAAQPNAKRQPKKHTLEMAKAPPVPVPETTCAVKPEVTFRRTETCAECPWLKDAPSGRFPPERFERLHRTVQQGFNPIFACHKTAEGHETACVGYLMVEGERNFAVRVALIQKAYDPRQLKATGPLYESYREMAEANEAELGEEDD